MKVLSVDDKNAIKTASKIITAGGLIVYPTDTLYGFGVDSKNQSAINKINEIKKRNSPISVICWSINIFSKWVEVSQDNLLEAAAIFKKICEKNVKFPKALTLLGQTYLDLAQETNKKEYCNTKKNFLNKPVEHIDITSFDSRDIISSMQKMSFVSRETGNAASIFNEMLKDKNCTIFLTLAGSTSEAGCMNIYKDMVKFNMVDAIVATGASIVDMDFFEGLGFKHYQGSQFQDDSELRKNYIDRIYDTYIDEDELQMCDKIICEIADKLPPKTYTSREFIYEMGRYLKDNSKKKGSLIETAFDNNVPIFCPAFTDSSAGFGLVMHQEKNPNKHITIDSIREFRELTEIKIKSKNSGLFMIGGGVPKNFIQDTVICAELLGKEVDMHKYAIQITVADSRDGACSSSTLKEASSWGKVDITKEQMVFAEATSVLPLIASDAYHRGEWKSRERKNFTKLYQK